MKKILFILATVLFILLFMSTSLCPFKFMQKINTYFIKDEIEIWKKLAIEGNITATSNLIVSLPCEKDKDKWMKLYEKQRKIGK